MELRKRLGGDWLVEPWAYTLYTYHLLREQDRRDAFFDRLHRLEAAQFMRIAMSEEPQRLDAEYRAHLRDAAGRMSTEVDADEVSRARQMIEALDRSGAMCDTDEQRAEHYRKYPRPVS